MPVLFEYETVRLDLTREQAESLQRTKRVEVSPASNGHWWVTATSHVGTLVVDGVELLIRPKINPENLFLLLEPGLPAEAWRSEAYDYDASSQLLPSVVAFFARTVETTLGRGLLRSYESRNELLVGLRGRVDVGGQLRRAGLVSPSACSFDDFSADILENRLLRAAIRLALEVPGVAATERQRLMKQLAALEGVSDVPVRPETFDKVHFTRLNQHYAPALALARLILANLTLVDSRGAVPAASFTVDMNDLFQRFLTERLRRALRGRLDVHAERRETLGVGGQAVMYPDLSFRVPGGGFRYVADIKYKLASDAKARSADYYQLLAYATVMDLPEGLLIYCRRQGETEQRSVAVRNSDKLLMVRAIDLAGPPAAVEREIAALADQIASAAGVLRV